MGSWGVRVAHVVAIGVATSVLGALGSAIGLAQASDTATFSARTFLTLMTILVVSWVAATRAPTVGPLGWLAGCALAYPLNINAWAGAALFGRAFTDSAGLAIGIDAMLWLLASALISWFVTNRAKPEADPHWAG